MRILLVFTVFFAAALPPALLLLPVPFSLSAAIVLLLAGIVVIRYRTGAAVALLGMAAGLIWAAGYLYLIMMPAASLTGQTIQITGTAIDYSISAASGSRVTANVSAGQTKTRAEVWLYTGEELSPGDTFTVTAKLADSAGESYYHRSEGVFLLAYGTDPPEILHREHVPLRYGPRLLAHRLEQSLRDCMPQDILGYALALTTGNRRALSTLECENLKTAGIYHTLALSGMHMTTLTGLLFLLIRNRKRRALLGIPLCILFTAMTGAGASLIRACVTQCLLLTAPLLGREEDAPTSMSAAAMLLMLQNPWCIFGWGTQLSFASMAGILLLSGKMYLGMAQIAGLKRRRRGKRLLRTVLSSLSVTVSAVICAAPLMMLYFGKLSLVSPLTNLLTGPMISFCFQGSLLTGLVGCVFPKIGGLLGWVVGWGFRYISLVAGAMARVPFSALYANSVYGVGWVLLCYGLLGLFYLTPKKQRSVVISVGCCICALAACIVLTLLENTGFVFTMLDVGQGQCLLARTNGQTMMIDCGGSRGEYSGDIAASYLDSVGEQRVDILILTHFDSDHVSGVLELMRRKTVAAIMLPAHESGGMARREIEAEARRQRTKLMYVRETVTATADSCVVTVFPSVHMEEENNTGLAVLLDYGDTEILVTGDMDMLGEKLLLHSHALPDVDILVAGHHGSKYSTSRTLLNQVRPEIVAISVGDNNYGHPAEETLARIEEFGAAVFRTDRNGTLRFRVNAD